MTESILDSFELESTQPWFTRSAEFLPFPEREGIPRRFDDRSQF